MRKQAIYPRPRFSDPLDKRLVSLINMSKKPMDDAINIVGIPFDGAVLGRKGARFGPSAIREAMVYFSNYDPELKISLLNARIFDLGDIYLKSNDVRRAHKAIEHEIYELILHDSLLAILGGDNSVSLPSIRAYSRKFGKIGLIVLDSHYDLRGEIDGRPSSGSSYGLAIRELKEALDPANVVEIGIHGFLNSFEYCKLADKLGISIYTADYVRENGAIDVAKSSYEIASNGTSAVYISLDLDCLDISEAPGVSAPSFGGLSSSELFDILYYLCGKEKVNCIDIVELSPTLDRSGKTSIVAATALVHVIAGFEVRRSLR